MFIRSMKAFSIGIIMCLMFQLLVSCSANQQSKLNETEKMADVESLIAYNKQLLREEQDQIDAFIIRYGWKMATTGTGLRYQIDSVGHGQNVRFGDRVSISYEVLLLTGEIIYSSDKQGIKTFVVGRGGVESGLEEGILLMKKGDRAKFVLPSHLAFGLLGDSEKIPSRNPIVYKVTIVKLETSEK